MVFDRVSNQVLKHHDHLRPVSRNRWQVSGPDGCTGALDMVLQIGNCDSERLVEADQRFFWGAFSAAE